MIAIERQRAFRRALSAFASPGVPQPPPQPMHAREALDAIIDALYGSAPPDPRRLRIFEEPPEPAAFAELDRGTELSPEDGATAIVLCGEAPTTTVRLRGPGIDGECEMALPLSPAALAVRDERCAYPLGIDILFITADGSYIGLPRTTIIEVH